MLPTGSATRALAFEDITVGQTVTPLVRGPMSTLHLMRWSAAIENWHRIHYDAPFATGHEHLPALLVNGSWKQHFLIQMMRAWIAPHGWLVKITFSFRKMDVVGDALTAHGEVTSTRVADGLGLVQCRIGIVNADGQESTPGTALVALPLHAGQRVPYPYLLARETGRP